MEPRPKCARPSNGTACAATDGLCSWPSARTSLRYARASRRGGLRVLRKIPFTLQIGEYGRLPFDVNKIRTVLIA